MSAGSHLPALLLSRAEANISRGNATYNEWKDYRDHCTIDTCPFDLSYWAYRPSLAANSTFLAIFALSLLLFLLQGISSKRFLGFTIAMVSGDILEVLGYVGRVMSYYNPFKEVTSLTVSYQGTRNANHSNCRTAFSCKSSA